MNSRQSAIVRLARIIQKTPLSWLRFSEYPIIRASHAYSNKPQSFLMILIALPRSGSTLTYQCLIHALKPYYLSNLWNLFYSIPLYSGFLSNHLCKNYKSDFISNHGFVSGLCGPAEGLRFWSYWTGCGLNENTDSILPSDVLTYRLEYLKNALSILTKSNSPMVTGYLGHSLIIEDLRHWFPDAIFVRLHRDPLSNALSILRSRPKNNNSDWFSVFPRECADSRKKDIYFQVASQVYWLNRRLSGLEKDVNTIHLNYEDLCANPRVQINRIIDFCNNRGMSLELKDNLPASFEYKVSQQKDSQEALKIATALSELESRYGPIN